MQTEKRYNVLILPSGQVDIIEHEDTLEFYQRAINGFIEIVRLQGNFVMVIDDEGKIKDLPVNILASWIYNSPDDFICGPALLDKRSGPDLVGMTHPEAIGEVMKIVRAAGESVVMEAD